jgi:4-amino-4-deoxy-L-arabinose transferase-like glycosyltransferase
MPQHDMPAHADADAPRLTARMAAAAARLRTQLLRRAGWIVAALALVRFIGLGFGELQAWDEALYALRSMGVLLFGAVWDQSALLPDGAYYAAHPPLYVWMSVLWTQIFGTEVWVFRLTSAIAAALIVVVLYRVLARRMSVVDALLAAAFFAVSPLAMFYSRQGQLDLVLALFMFLAVLGAARHARTGAIAPLAGAVFALGAALMTKSLFALIVPVGLLLAGFRTEGAVRRRLIVAAFLTPILSMPLWLPWLWSWIGTHAGGDVLALFEGRTPLARTLAGGEGVAKASGAFYYLNQLVVELSVLFPLFAIGIVRAALAREGATITVLAAVAVVHLFVVHLPASSFAVYLIPLLPLACIIAVHVMRRVPDWDPLEQSVTFAAMLLSALWSASSALRASVRDLFAALARLETPAGGDIAAVVAASTFAAAAVLLVIVLHRRELVDRSVRIFAVGVTAIIAVATLVRIWFVDPAACTDGAAAIAARVQELPVRDIALVGDGENPQLTWYLGGRDAGWISHDERRYLRLQPRLRGVEGVRDVLAQMHATGAVGVILEKDLGRDGRLLFRKDALPDDAVLLLETSRYALYMLR